MKRVIVLFLALVMLFSISACGTVQAPIEPEETERAFTDSLGREVTFSAEIEKVAVSGPLAQLVVFSLCSDKVVGIAAAWDDSAKEFLDEKYYDLPVLGQLYGGKGDLNPESLLQSGAEVVIDIGESKDGMADDLNRLQEQTGIPFVHISAAIETMGDAYRQLGELLDMQTEAEVLAVYCEDTYARIYNLAEGMEKVRALYVLGDAGQNVIAKNSYHSQVFDLLCDNLAVVEEPSAKGTGNEVGLEQILLWDPDYIVFAPNSVYGEVGNDPIWQTLSAVQNGKYCEVPSGPDNWMGFPPGVQRYLGMLWLGKVLYGDAAEYDLYAEAATFYRLFYHCELTQEQFDFLTAHSGL